MLGHIFIPRIATIGQPLIRFLLCLLHNVSLANFLHFALEIDFLFFYDCTDLPLINTLANILGLIVWLMRSKRCDFKCITR